MNISNYGNMTITNPVITLNGGFSASGAFLDDNPTLDIRFTVKNTSGTKIVAFSADLDAGNTTLCHSDIVAKSLTNNYSATITLSFDLSGDDIDQYFAGRRSQNAFDILITGWSALEADGSGSGSGERLSGVDINGEPLTLVDAHYNPTFYLLDVARCEDEDSMEESDEGEQLLLHVTFGYETEYGHVLTNAMSGMVETDHARYAISTGKYMLMEILNATPLYYEFGYSIGTEHTVNAFFGDQFEMATARTVVPVAFANMHLSGAKHGGVAFGRFSSSTDDEPKFECMYPAYFYGGINALSFEKNESVVGTFADGKPIYRRTATNVSFTGAQTLEALFGEDFEVDTLIGFHGAGTNGTAWYEVGNYHTSSYYIHARLTNSKTARFYSAPSGLTGWVAMDYTKK